MCKLLSYLANSSKNIKRANIWWTQLDPHLKEHTFFGWRDNNDDKVLEGKANGPYTADLHMPSAYPERLIVFAKSIEPSFGSPRKPLVKL